MANSICKLSRLIGLGLFYKQLKENELWVKTSISTLPVARGWRRTIPWLPAYFCSKIQLPKIFTSS